MASDSDFPEAPPPPDPVVDAQVDEALEVFKALLPPEVLEDFRQFTADALSIHEVASLYVSRTRERPEKSSGVQVRNGAPNAVPESEAGKKTGGGRR